MFFKHALKLKGNKTQPISMFKYGIKIERDRIGIQDFETL